MAGIGSWMRPCEETAAGLASGVLRVNASGSQQAAAPEGGRQISRTPQRDSHQQKITDHTEKPRKKCKAIQPGHPKGNQP